MTPALHTHSGAAARAERAARNQALGAYGEALAAAYLVERGCTILDRNWRSRSGELDLVVRAGETLVAVEVKTRRGTGYGTPLSAVTPRKTARLRLLLGEWLRLHSEPADTLRIDAIGIVLRTHAAPQIEHLRGIG
ncbi:YraN family protein [Leucobacter chromiireducens]|uniref:YraN family protein n=1 Tax=Leucobacter chromiireducens TaxID=283877 RepID=UPI000F63632A|nr:YraN family protein [Leucobacter chromiireducens]